MIVQQRRALVFFGVITGSFIILLFFTPRLINLFDEGIILVNAMRMLDGQLPHRDFYSCYGPAQYLIVATLFKIFGANAVVARIYGILIYAAVIATVYDTLRQRVQTTFAIGATCVVGLWFWIDSQPLYPVFPCILLALWASNLILCENAESKFRRQYLIAGLFTGLVTLFRYDAGFFLMLAHLVAISFIATVIPWNGASPSPRENLKNVVIRALTYGTGIGIIFLPCAVAFLMVAPVQGFITDIINYPSQYYFRMRALPFPDLQQIGYSPIDSVVYLPLLACLLACLTVLRKLGKFFRIDFVKYASQKLSQENIAFLIIYGLTSFAFFFKGVVRVSPVHMIMANVPAIMVMALVLQCLWNARKIQRLFAIFAGMLILAPAVHAGFGQAIAARKDISRTLGGWAVGQMGVKRFIKQAPFGCSIVVNDNAMLISFDYLRAARFVQANSLPEEKLFIGLSHHDRVLMNAVTGYFAAQRLPATHWHTFDPGLQNRADIQKEIITELRQQRTRLLILDNSFDSLREPNGSSLSSGVTFLDDFIKTHYHPVATSGEVAIWLLNGATLVTGAALQDCMAEPVSKTAFAEIP